MARSQKRSPLLKRQKQLQQPYDSALKSLMGDEAAEILPHLLPEAEYISEENTEIDRTTLKADLVYNIWYKRELHILNLELQTAADKDILIRILKYHVELYDKHRLPVISVILFPFETSLPKNPFEEKSAAGLLLLFPCWVVLLWKLDAQECFDKGVVAMYTFLPAMKGVTAPLLVQAIEKMKHHYNKRRFGDHLARFRIILQRSQTISEQDKQIVEGHLKTYNSLMDTSPYVLGKMAEARAEAEAKARAKAEVQAAEAEVQGAQKIVVGIVEVRFPALTEVAQQHVALIRSTKQLNQLAKQIVTAPDEASARWLLDTFVD